MNYYDINPFHGLFGNQDLDNEDIPGPNNYPDYGEPCTEWPPDDSKIHEAIPSLDVMICPDHAT